MSTTRISLLLIAFTGCAFTGCAFTPPDVSGDDPGAMSPDASPDPGTPPPDANGFRRDIRIAPPAGVSSDVQDIALPIRLVADAHFMANADPSGQDILVRSADGTALAIDFEILDVSAGELLAWVKVPTVAPSGSDLALFYGTGQTAPTVSGNPWQGLAEAVWHLDAVGSGTAPTVSDATSNGLHGVKEPAGTVATVPAVHGNGFDWNATQILFATNSTLDRRQDESFSIVFWFNQQNARSAFDFAFHNGGPIDDLPGYEFSLGRGNWTAGIRDTGGDELTLLLGTESNLGSAGWHQLALVVDRDAEVARAYVDGVEVDTGSVDEIEDLRNNSRQARIGGGLNPPDALIDEFRAYSIAVSADYLRLDHALGSDSEVVTISAPVAVRYPGT